MKTSLRATQVKKALSKPPMHQILKPRDGHVVRLFMFVFLFMATGTSTFAQGDLLESVALLEDPTGSLSIDKIAERDFEPVGETISLGYSQSVIWLRLHVLPAPGGGEVALSLGASKPKSLKLFAPSLIESHDANPSMNISLFQEIVQNWPSPQPAFRINPPKGGADYFFQIETSGSKKLHVAAETLHEAMTTTEQRYVVQITYLAAMFLIMVWAFYIFSFSKICLFALFGVLQFTWFWNNIFYLGYDDFWLSVLSEDAKDQLFRSSFFVTSFFTIMFHRNVMQQYEPAYMALRLFDVLCVVVASSFVAFYVLDEVLALQLNAICLSLLPALFLVNILSSKNNTSSHFLLVQFIYIALSASFLLNSFAVLGPLNSQIITMHGYLIHGGVNACLFTLYLTVMARKIRHELRLAQIKQKELERQNALEREKTSALSTFMEMLGHEAKNALTVIQMSMPVHMMDEKRRVRSEGAIQGLTNVIERCGEVIRLDNNEHIVSRQSCDLLGILQNLFATAEDPTRFVLDIKEPAIMKVDPALLNIILGNLLDNAVKYSQPYSKIFVSSHQENGGHSILVENAQGPAGSPDPNRLFTKYYRSQGARSEIGSGLGLYIVRGLVQLMDGRIDYVPREDRACFRVWLPC